MGIVNHLQQDCRKAATANRTESKAMTALHELRMQSLLNRQVQSKALLPSQVSARSKRQRRVRKTHTTTLAAQSSGLTSSVELGPAEEQATSSSQGNASAIDQVNLESQVGSQLPPEQQFFIDSACARLSPFPHINI